jgi:hypothetical protein
MNWKTVVTKVASIFPYQHHLQNLTQPTDNKTPNKQQFDYKSPFVHAGQGQALAKG